MKVTLFGHDIELTIRPSRFVPTVQLVWVMAKAERVQPNKIDLIRAVRQLSIDQGFPVMSLKEAKEWVEAQSWPK